MGGHLLRKYLMSHQTFHLLHWECLSQSSLPLTKKKIYFGEPKVGQATEWEQLHVCRGATPGILHGLTGQFFRLQCKACIIILPKPCLNKQNLLLALKKKVKEQITKPIFLKQVLLLSLQVLWHFNCNLLFKCCIYTGRKAVLCAGKLTCHH